MAKIEISYSQKCDICGTVNWLSTEKDCLDQIKIPVMCCNEYGNGYKIAIRKLDACQKCLSEVYKCISEKYTAEDVEWVGTIVKRREG